MDEELKEELRKIYHYENNIDFDSFENDCIRYKPSIREIDKKCIKYIKTKINNIEFKKLVLELKKVEIKDSIEEHKYSIEKELNKLKILKKEILENDKFIEEEKKQKFGIKKYMRNQ